MKREKTESSFTVFLTVILSCYLNNVVSYTSSVMLWKCHRVPHVKEWWCHNQSLALSEIHKLRNILQNVLSIVLKLSKSQIYEINWVTSKTRGHKKGQDHLSWNVVLIWMMKVKLYLESWLLVKSHESIIILKKIR